MGKPPSLVLLVFGLDIYTFSLFSLFWHSYGRGRKHPEGKTYLKRYWEESPIADLVPAKGTEGKALKDLSMNNS